MFLPGLFWSLGNIVSAVPSILGLFEPPAVSVFSLFWLRFTLTGTDVQFASVTLSDKHWPAARLCSSLVPTVLKLLELAAILKEQVNINAFSCCAAAGCKMALRCPFPPCLLTMCDGLIRNWYRRDNGCLVLCLSRTEILSLSAASTPSPACSLALSSSPSSDSWPM